MNDLIRLACERAVARFGVGDTFNGANFSAVFVEMAGVNTTLDGKIVRTMLAGRPDIEVLAGSSHYRLLEMDDVSRRYRRT